MATFCFPCYYYGLKHWTAFVALRRSEEIYDKRFYIDGEGRELLYAQSLRIPRRHIIRILKNKFPNIKFLGARKNSQFFEEVWSDGNQLSKIDSHLYERGVRFVLGRS